MRHLNKTDIVDLLEELGVNTEPLKNPKYDVPEDISNPYGRPMLEIVMERIDRFGKSCDPGYRTIKEQEEDEKEDEEDEEE